jgi:Flp pilus assembly protein TadB
MAQTKKKRRRKHRGTQAGTVEARGRTGRSATRADASKLTRQQRAKERLSKPPTWQNSMNRAAIAAAIFGVALAVVFKRPVQAAVFLALFMFVLYIPLGYYTDLFIYRRRQRRK